MFSKIDLTKIPRILIAKYVGATLAHGFGIGTFCLFGFMGFGNMWGYLTSGENFIELSFNEAITALVVLVCCMFIIVCTGSIVDDLWVKIVEANKKEG